MSERPVAAETSAKKLLSNSLDFLDVAVGKTPKAEEVLNQLKKACSSTDMCYIKTL